MRWSQNTKESRLLQMRMKWLYSRMWQLSRNLLLKEMVETMMLSFFSPWLLNFGRRNVLSAHSSIGYSKMLLRRSCHTKRPILRWSTTLKSLDGFSKSMKLKGFLYLAFLNKEVKIFTGSDCSSTNGYSLNIYPVLHRLLTKLMQC